MEDKRCRVFVEGKECGLPLTLLEGEVRKIAIYEVVTYKCSLGHRSYFLHEPRSSRRSTGAKRLGSCRRGKTASRVCELSPPGATAWDLSRVLFAILLLRAATMETRCHPPNA